MVASARATEVDNDHAPLVSPTVASVSIVDALERDLVATLLSFYRARSKFLQVTKVWCGPMWAGTLQLRPCEPSPICI